jgi:membrane protease YdiL (CAAX protease family)
VKYVVNFGKFWYDFVIGDDWRIAAGVVVVISAVYFAAHHGFNGWFVLPVAVALLLGVSVSYEMRRRR